MEGYKMCSIIIKTVALGIVLMVTMFYVDAWFNGFDQAYDNLFVLPKEY
jgi:hypothetical protein